MSVTPPDIQDPGSNPPSVVVEENLATVAFEGNSKGFTGTLEGDTNIESDGDLKDASVTIKTEKNQTISTEVSAKLVRNGDFGIDGKGSGQLLFDAAPEEDTAASSRAAENGLVQKTSITGGKKGDSVTFTGKTTVQRTSMDLGKGADTVQFGAKTQFVGKTTIDLGAGGRDKVIFKGSNTAEGGKVVIENFDSKDKLLVNGEVLKQSDLEDGEKIDGIKIEFAD